MPDNEHITEIVGMLLEEEGVTDHPRGEARARTFMDDLASHGYRIVPKTPEYQSRYVTLKLTYYKEDVPKVHIQSVAGLEGLLLGGSFSNLVVWNDLGPAIRRLLQANHDWPPKESE